MNTDAGTGARRLSDAGATVGRGVRAWLGGELTIGAGVVIEDGVTIVADDLTLGAGVRLGAGCDVRASSVMVGAGSELQERVHLLVADRFAVGQGSRLEHDVSITCRRFSAGDLFYLGHDSSVGYGGTTASTALVQAGDRVAIGPHSILNANYPITLGDQVGSGCYLSIWTHGFHFGHRLLDGYGVSFAEVRVERNVWLGYHVTVLPGVHIGANTILAAGAVVAGDLPADVLAGGVPAVVKRPLAPAPLLGQVAHERIGALLADWAAELTWKGVAVAREPSGDFLVGADHRVSLVPPGAPSPPPDGRTVVLVSVDDRTDLHPPTGTLFELRSGEVSGPLDDIGHDLRDFLRRHALPCGSAETFRSLPAEAFRRLRHPDQARTPDDVTTSVR